MPTTADLKRRLEASFAASDKGWLLSHTTALDGPGAARKGWFAVTPVGRHKYLGTSLPDIWLDLARKAVEHGWTTRASYDHAHLLSTVLALDPETLFDLESLDAAYELGARLLEAHVRSVGGES